LGQKETMMTGKPVLAARDLKKKLWQTDLRPKIDVHNDNSRGPVVSRVYPSSRMTRPALNVFFIDWRKSSQHPFHLRGGR
jgi:hypothetical protein